MSELILESIEDLPIERQNFEGVSIPYFRETEYGVVNLDAYEKHLLNGVGTKIRSESGVQVMFDGFKNLFKLDPNTSSDPNAKVYYNYPTKSFVFLELNKYCVSHKDLSAVYNDETTNMAKVGKAFMYGSDIYVVDKNDGVLKKVSATKVVSSPGTSEEDAASQKMVTDGLKKVEDEQARMLEMINDIDIYIDGGEPDSVHGGMPVIDCGEI